MKIEKSSTPSPSSTSSASKFAYEDPSINKDPQFIKSSKSASLPGTFFVGSFLNSNLKKLDLDKTFTNNNINSILTNRTQIPIKPGSPISRPPIAYQTKPTLLNENSSPPVLHSVISSHMPIMNNSSVGSNSPLNNHNKTIITSPSSYQLMNRQPQPQQLPYGGVNFYPFNNNISKISVQVRPYETASPTQTHKPNEILFQQRSPATTPQLNKFNYLNEKQQNQPILSLNHSSPKITTSSTRNAQISSTNNSSNNSPIVYRTELVINPNPSTVNPSNSTAYNLNQLPKPFNRSIN